MMQQHRGEYNARLHPKCKIETRGKRYNFDEFDFHARSKIFLVNFSSCQKWKNS